MPERPFDRNLTYLLPPSLDEWVDAGHPVRFVAAFIDLLDQADWDELEVGPDPATGAPRYAPRMLLSVWLAGFMLKIRSARGLERACREQLPFRWLTAGQTPDHNTLWRFYAGHRDKMRVLLRRTIQTAVRADLLELAVQAVDGSKVLANASKDKTVSAVHLQQLLVKTNEAITELESRQGGEDEPPPNLPPDVQHAVRLRERLERALEETRADDAQSTVNLTDPQARWMQTRQGVAPAYNAQAVVVALNSAQAGRPGRFILAADVSQANTDNHLLEPMIAEARIADVPVPTTVADGGYYSGASLEACAQAGYSVVVKTSQPPPTKSGAYSRTNFQYDAETDRYTCPQGTPLTFRGTTTRKSAPPLAIYRPDPQACRTCVAFGECTTDARHGRCLRVSRFDQTLQAHGQWMETDEAKALQRQRKTLIEPVFGILKEQMGGRRSLLRGADKVKAEWMMLATAFNLRTLAGIWSRSQIPLPSPVPA